MILGQSWWNVLLSFSFASGGKRGDLRRRAITVVFLSSVGGAMQSSMLILYDASNIKLFRHFTNLAMV